MTEEYFFEKKISDYLSLKKNTVSSLDRLDVNQIKKILLHIPHYYKIIKLFPKISDIKNDDEVVLKIEVTFVEIPRKRSSPFKILAKTADGSISLVFFKYHQSLINQFFVGSVKFIAGKAEFYDYRLQISHPQILYDITYHCGIEPIYPLTYGITNSQLRNYIVRSLQKLENQTEWLPQSIVQKYNLIKFKQAISIIHAINNTETSEFNLNSRNFASLLEKAKLRLKIDELFANQVSLEKLRKNRENFTGVKIFPQKIFCQKILDNLSFQLTIDQLKVETEILEDFLEGKQMLRMLQGDVGSGKTLVAVLTSICAVKAGFQVALMAPTDILARQHYNFYLKALKGLFYAENNNGSFIDGEIPIAYLSGGTKAKNKKIILEKIANNEIKIIVGTHALFQEKVKFSNLGYIIVDEQHRFGVNQRIELAKKGNNPHILIMSATPIPRSLAITIFGDMKISAIKTKPKGRMEIDTSAISEKKIPELIEALDRKINNDERIYWICPLIEKKDEELGNEVNSQNSNDQYNLSNVVDRYNHLESKYPGKVGLLHGKMKADEKEAAIKNFKDGIFKILVSTTVVEVGVDVPEATLMIIENSERFGLAQLHQLRGRVGRGSLKSSCILIYGKFLSKEGKERIKILKESNDGFYISEKDLVLRGGGEILGEKQSGEENFKFLNLMTDSQLIVEVSKIVENLAKNENLDNKNFEICSKFFEKNSKEDQLKIL